MTRIDRALSLCKGRYQANLISGSETWSGSSLRGKARKYGGRYARSRCALLERLEDAGVAYLEIVKAGKIKLRFGKPVGNYIETACAAGRAWKKGEPTVLDLMVTEEPAP